MNVAVLGCGAIGGMVAANLTRAGIRVVPVTGNAAISEAIATHGYRVRELDGTTWSQAPSASPRVAIGDLGDAAGVRFDVVVCATKATQLEAALASALPHLAPGATVLCLQNGLPEDHAAAVVGKERVAGCIVGFGASMIEPGLYLRTSRGGFTLGLPYRDLAGAPDLPSLARLLEPAGPALVVEDLAAVRWSKLAINCCTSSIGATGGAPLGVLLRRRFARRIALEVFAEVNAVARAAGIRPAPVGGTFDIAKVSITDDERAMRFGSPSLAMKHSILLAVGFKYRRLRSSMLYAIERGRQPEIDFLNGEVVRRGQLLGVPTPVNAGLVEAIHAITRGAAHPSVATLRRLHERYQSAAMPLGVGPARGGERLNS